MKPRVTLITLGVDDLARSLRFYRDGLGLTTEGIVGSEYEHGAVVFFELEGGLKLALWLRHSLGRDAGLAVGCPVLPTSLSATTSPPKSRSIWSWPRRQKRERLSSCRPGTPSGAVMPDISRTRTSTCGKLRGTPMASD